MFKYIQVFFYGFLGFILFFKSCYNCILNYKNTEINCKQNNFFLIVKALMANISLNHGFIFFLTSENIHSHSQKMILNF